MAIRPKFAMPHTRNQKGKGWATLTLLACAAFSVYANIRSGQLYRDSIVVSVLPPVVAFLSTKLLAFLSPRTNWTKVLVYGGFGLISVLAMYGSGWHIVEFVSRNGQPWQTAISYVFLADAPMLLAAYVLVQKVPMTQTSTKPTIEDKTPQAAQSTQAVSTSPKRTTPAKATKSTTPAKKATPAKVASPSKNADPMMDPFERDMLRA